MRTRKCQPRYCHRSGGKVGCKADGQMRSFRNSVELYGPIRRPLNELLLMAPLTHCSIEQQIERRCGQFAMRVTKCCPNTFVILTITRVRTLERTATCIAAVRKLSGSAELAMALRPIGASVWLIFRFAAILPPRMIDGFQSDFGR